MYIPLIYRHGQRKKMFWEVSMMEMSKHSWMFQTNRLLTNRFYGTSSIHEITRIYNFNFLPDQ